MALIILSPTLIFIIFQLLSLCILSVLPAGIYQGRNASQKASYCHCGSNNIFYHNGAAPFFHVVVVSFLRIFITEAMLPRIEPIVAMMLMTSVGETNSSVTWFSDIISGSFLFCRTCVRTVNYCCLVLLMLMIRSIRPPISLPKVSNVLLSIMHSPFYWYSEAVWLL